MIFFWLHVPCANVATACPSTARHSAVVQHATARASIGALRFHLMPFHVRESPRLSVARQNLDDGHDSPATPLSATAWVVVHFEPSKIAASPASPPAAQKSGPEQRMM